MRALFSETGPRVNYEEGVKNPTKPGVVLAFLVALFALGCGDDCESTCEDRKECRNADRSVDCAEYCENLEKLHGNADCEDQYEALTQCEGEQEDICEMEEDACRSESKRYADCLAAYCVDHERECE
jgi:hypothetical protein